MKTDQEVIQEALAAKKNQTKEQEAYAIQEVKKRFPDAAYIGDFKFTLGGFTWEHYEGMPGCLCVKGEMGLPDYLIRDMADFGEVIEEWKEERAAQDKWDKLSFVGKIRYFFRGDRE